MNMLLKRAIHAADVARAVRCGLACAALLASGGLLQAQEADAPAALVPEQDFSGVGLVLGETHQGELLVSHPQMPDDTHADCFQLETTEQKVYTVTLRSTDFDSYLLVGVGFCQDVMLQYANDDFEDGSRDAQIVFTAEYPFYSVYVNTYEPAAVGTYTLHVDEQNRQEVALSGDH